MCIADVKATIRATSASAHRVRPGPPVSSVHATTGFPAFTRLRSPFVRSLTLPFGLTAASLCWAAVLPFSAWAEPAITLRHIDTHHAGLFAQSAAEIPAFCPKTRRVFVVNAQSGRVDVFRLSEAGRLESLEAIDAAHDVPGNMRAVNSVCVSNGRLAVAVEAEPTTDPGAVAFYDTATLAFSGSVAAGALPDMVTFSPDGRWALVANEGESNDDATIDPDGTVTIIDLSGGIPQAKAREVAFRDWNDGGARVSQRAALMRGGLRYFGRVGVPGDPRRQRATSFSADVEPEWIEIDSGSRTAYVCLQEANAIAVIDIASATVERLMPLGFKDHGSAGNELDTSDKDGGFRPRCWPGLCGVFQPDTIRLFEAGGRRYLVTANEGDSRVRPYADDVLPGVKEGTFFSDEVTLRDWPTAGSRFADATADADLGRLKLVRDLVERHLDAEGRPMKLFAFGGRSFSIFDAETGAIVFDSGSDFERVTAERHPDHFNCSNDSVTRDKRSRSKGPEPEGLVLGVVEGKTYAFIGLERTGGIMVYDITEPAAARFIGYHTNRRFDVPITLSDGTPNPEAGDTGIEGLAFVPAEQSPTGTPLVIAGNETSGTTTVWEVVATAPTQRSQKPGTP